MSRQRRRARHLPPVRRKGLRRVHGVCVALVLLGAAGFWMSLGSHPPVPIEGESRATMLGVSGGVLLVCAALISWLLKETEDRMTACFTAFLVIGLTMGLTVPDLLYRLNTADPQASPHVDVQERFVLLTEHSPAKRLDYFVLHTVPRTKPVDLAGATQRHISRLQYEALQEAALQPGQLLQLRIVEGRLGWPYVQAAAPAP